MNISLNLYQTRVIGVLIEKEITTPEQYPLSLNALVNGCNQKSNRDPVLELSETIVQQTIDELVKQHLVSEKTGSRVAKFQHRFCNSEFGRLKFSAQELGIVCELLLRGAQTPGELRSNTNRLCRFNDVHEVEAALHQLSQREDGPFVVRLEREPGKREARYAHLFSGEIETGADEPVARESKVSPSGSDRERLCELEQQVQKQAVEIEQLKHRVDQLMAKSASQA